MSQIKGKDTGPERTLRSALQRLGLRFRKHEKRLPGKPDIIFPTQRIAVFIDGDFWHGYRFPTWQHKVSGFWKTKITKNRNRDLRNFRRLRRWGWRVIRIWQHDIESDLNRCISRITAAIRVTNTR